MPFFETFILQFYYLDSTWTLGHIKLESNLGGLLLSAIHRLDDGFRTSLVKITIATIIVWEY